MDYDDFLFLNFLSLLFDLLRNSGGTTADHSRHISVMHQNRLKIAALGSLNRNKNKHTIKELLRKSWLLC
jgi:hypothetical protein